MTEQEPFVLPETITFLSPRPTRQPRGLNAGKVADSAISVKYNEEELNSLRTAADILGMTKSDYLRWIALFCSHEVMRLYNISRARLKSR